MRSKVQARMLIVILSVVLVTSVTAQPGLSSDVRAAVYRITTPSNKIGTAILFKHFDHFYLVTNKHVLLDNSESLVDSLSLFLNEITSNDEVLSVNKYRTVHLTLNGKPFYFLPNSQDLDLILISIALENTDFDSGSDTLYSFDTKQILSEKDTETLLGKNPVLTAIGFPIKKSQIDTMTKYAEYRWGRYLRKWRDGMFSDIPILPGSSGSPIVGKYDNTYYLVGIVTQSNDTLCYSISAHLIKDNFSRFFRLVESRILLNDSLQVQEKK